MIRRSLIGAASLVLALSACGGSDNSSDELSSDELLDNPGVLIDLSLTQLVEDNPESFILMCSILDDSGEEEFQALLDESFIPEAYSREYFPTWSFDQVSDYTVQWFQENC